MCETEAATHQRPYVITKERLRNIPPFAFYQFPCNLTNRCLNHLFHDFAAVKKIQCLNTYWNHILINVQHVRVFYSDLCDINAKTSSQTYLIHGAGPIWYKDVIPPKSLYFNFHEAHIIGATILIDSAFDHPDEHRVTSSTPTTTDITLCQFKNHLISLAAGFSTMNDALNFSVKDILYNLSKSLESVSSHRISGHSPEIQHVWLGLLVFPVIRLDHNLLRFCFLPRCMSMISFECILIISHT